MRLLVFSLMVVLSLSGCKNFHEVGTGGEFFRSAQLSDKELEHHVKTYNIKTVINLRGMAPGEKWWEKENALAKKMGLTYINIAMNAGRIPHRNDVLQLLDAYDNAPRPILIHCRRGADRTGEASAMWVFDQTGGDREAALEQLNSRFYYFSTFVPAKKYFIKEIYHGKEWARTEYEPCHQDYKHYDKAKYCNVPVHAQMAMTMWRKSEDVEPEEKGRAEDLPPEEREHFKQSKKLF